MKINPLLVKVPARYGLAGFILTAISFVVFYYVGLQPWRNLLSLILDVLLIGACCFAAIKDFKANYNNGILSFYHGMTAGFVVYIIVGLAFGLFYRIFIEFIEPEFLSNYIELAKEDMINRKDIIIKALGEESYTKNFESLGSTNASVLMVDAMIKKFLIGLLITPVFSVILRTHLSKKST